MKARVGTIISRNHAPAARVLARSLARRHPELRLTVLNVDQEVLPLDDHDEPFEVVAPEEVGVERAELHELAAIYDALELCEALKPRLLRHLVSGADAALYLDSDIEVLSRVDDLLALAYEHSTLLVPHLTEPLPRDGLVPTEEDLLAGGVYNAGVIAAGPRSEAFLDWWQSQLRRNCIHDIVGGLWLFGDQHWLDFVPSLFEHAISRDPGCDVAWWNLASRTIARDGDGVYRVDGAPLRLFHYSFFDPYVPHLLHDWQAEYPHRTRVARDHPYVTALCQRYAAALMANGYHEESRIPYGFDRSAGGLPLDRRMRRLYREALVRDTERTGGERRHRAVAAAHLPDPFSPDETDLFLGWLRTPTGGTPPVSQYLWLVYDDRFDLQAVFPELQEKGDSTGFLEWVRVYGGVEEAIPRELIAPPTRWADSS
jgi:hypothetical protein